MQPTRGIARSRIVRANIRLDTVANIDVKGRTRMGRMLLLDRLRTKRLPRILTLVLVLLSPALCSIHTSREREARIVG